MHCLTIVSISDSLSAAVVDIRKFNANPLHSADVSKIAYMCYNLENVTYSHIKDFSRRIFL